MRILLALTGVLALAACGSSPDTPPAAPTSTASDGRQLAQCMRDHGVDMPDPDPNGKPGDIAKLDRDNPAFKQAMNACKQFLPYGGDLSKADPKLVDQLRGFTRCLREHGLDVPDPDPNAADLGLGSMANIDRDSPAAKQAFDACKDKMPGRPGQ